MDQLFCCVAFRKKDPSQYEQFLEDSKDEEEYEPIDYTSTPSDYQPPKGLDKKPVANRSSPFDYTSANPSGNGPEQNVYPGKKYRIILPLGIDIRNGPDPISKVDGHLACGTIVEVLEVTHDTAKIEQGWIRLSNAIGKRTMAPEKDILYLSEWTCDDVCTWLTTVEFENLQYRFLESSLDGPTLSTLTVGGLQAHPFNLAKKEAKRMINHINLLTPMESMN